MTRARLVSIRKFWPRPEVASAVIRLVPSEPWDDREYQHFLATVKTLFGQRRKKLRTQLRAHFGLSPDQVDQISSRIGLDPDKRPEQIEAEMLRKLAAVLPEKETS